MALPPSHLYAYLSNPSDTVVKLYRHGLLRSDVDVREAVQALERVRDAYDPVPGMVGPNLTDLYAQAISPFLNGHGDFLSGLLLNRTTPEDEAEVLRVKEAAWRERNGDDPPPWAPGPPLLRTLLGCVLGGGGVIGFHLLLYMGLLALVPHAELSRWHVAGGTVLALFVGGTVSIMGESLIEDVVKFVLLGGAALAIGWGSATPLGGVILGIPVGAAFPLLMRPVARWWGPGSESP